MVNINDTDNEDLCPFKTDACNTDTFSSLSVGHYELCRDDIGDLPGSPEHL